MNYYEVLGLPCDGKERDNIGKIQLAIDSLERNLDFAINNESSEAKRKPLREQKDELPKMKLLLTDANLRKQHAEELREQRIKQLIPIIKILSECAKGTNKKSVANARVNKIASNVGLLPETVKKEFKNAGYEIITSPLPNTDDFLMRDSVLNKLEEDVNLLKDYMKRNPNDPMQEMLGITDIYEYISVIDGNSLSKSQDYRTMPTDQLRGIFEINMAKHVNNNAPILYYNHIESQAKTQILRDDSQRNKYDNTLKLLKLSSFFETLKLVPDSIKSERTFAEECISKIQNEFNDETQSIAIYNKYGGISPDTPYEKESTTVVTICSCQTINFHDTLEEAHKATCSNCKSPLYKLCPSCGKYTPTIADYCSCGFFMKGVQAFERYYLEFKDAIDKQDLNGATISFQNARACNPKDTRISEMQTRLKHLDDIYGIPMKRIEELIAEGKINSAQKAVIKLRSERPAVDLKHFEKQIITELEWANREFSKCKSSVNKGVGVEICVGITSRVKDYEPALDWLRMNKPDPVLRVNGVKDANALTFTLQWDNNPNNRFVTYTIVRKENGKPTNIQDGKKLTDGIKNTNYKDTTLEPGKVYGYAVFAIREDTESLPAYYNEFVCLLKDIESVQVNINNGICSLSWIDVPGSRGTRVLRSEDGGKQWTIMNQCCRGLFSDTQARNGAQYKYILQSVWELNQKVYYSQGLVREVKIEDKPKPIVIELKSVGGDGTCDIIWKTQGNGAFRLIMINSEIEIVQNRVYNTMQLDQLGKCIAAAIPVNSGHFSWCAQTGKLFKVVAFRMYGDEAVAGNTISISTIPSLKIDEVNTSITNNVLRMSFQAIPNGVTRVYYLVSSDNSYATEKMVLDGALKSIDVSAYMHDRVIIVENLPEKELYISVYAMYGTGSNTYLSPVTKYQISNAPKEKVEYWIEWKTAGWPVKHSVRKGALLWVKTTCTRIPEMNLCCRQDGKMIFNYVPGIPGVVELLKIPSTEVEAGTSHSFALDESKMSGIPSETDIQLFLKPIEITRYSQPLATDIRSRKMP